MIDGGKSYAVLTGDLIKSSRLTSDMSKKAMERLKKLAGEFAGLNQNTIVGRMDTFRHDSWQLLLERPALAFRAAVFLRTALKMESRTDFKYDTRISIGMGTVESVSKRRISDSRGEAFTLSGKGLDTIKNRCLVFVPDETSSSFLPGLERGVIPLLDCVTGDWTPTESRAVYGALKGWTQEEAAQQWPPDRKTGKRPSRQAVGKSLIRAHWKSVEAVLMWIEKETTQSLRVA